MAQLPLRLAPDQQAQQWKAIIDPLLANQLTQGSLIKGISLINGSTTINHLLGRMMVGWMIVDINASANVYRSKPLNDKTLTLTSDAPATVNLWCF